MNWETLYTKLITERVSTSGELHHIVPRSLGGTDTPDNLVMLTHRNHTLAHYIRYRWLGHYQDRVAYKMMSGQQLNPMHDDEILQQFREYMKLPSTRDKYSIAAKIRFQDPELRKKVSEHRKKYVHSLSDTSIMTAHLQTDEIKLKNTERIVNWTLNNPKLA